MQQMANIHWIAKYSHLNHGSNHSHSFFQALFTISGNGNVVVDGTTFHPEYGDFIIIPPDTGHAIQSNDSDGKIIHKVMDIKFTINSKELKTEFLKLPTFFHIEHSERFLNKTTFLMNEAKKQDYYSNDVLNMAFSIAIIDLIRQFNKNEEDTSDYSDEIKSSIGNIKGINIDDLITFINLNFNKIISLNDLSSFACINKSTLICIFKELYNTTPIKYINVLRMKKAKELLVNSDISISEISEMIGFQTIHYFSRYFKEKEGCSPIEFRRKNNGCNYITIHNDITED